jgi:hypothetical protein
MREIGGASTRSIQSVPFWAEYPASRMVGVQICTNPRSIRSTQVSASVDR